MRSLCEFECVSTCVLAYVCVCVTWRATQGVSWTCNETSSPSRFNFLEYRAPERHTGGETDRWRDRQVEERGRDGERRVE